MPSPQVTAIHILEDLTARARCDEGFLHVRRFVCRNERKDGTRSEPYRVDVVDRPRLDAVAVLIYRRVGRGTEVLTRTQLRPAAYFRKDKRQTVPDGRVHLAVEEIVAGLLETTDSGEQGLRQRAAAEVWEEAGIRVSPEDVQRLGAPFFLAPGILSEKVFLMAVDVTGKRQVTPEGDGTPLEEGSRLRWRKPSAVLEDCVKGRLQDVKTEVAIRRWLERPKKARKR